MKLKVPFNMLRVRCSGSFTEISGFPEAVRHHRRLGAPASSALLASTSVGILLEEGQCTVIQPQHITHPSCKQLHDENENKKRSKSMSFKHPCKLGKERAASLVLAAVGIMSEYDDHEVVKKQL